MIYRMQDAWWSLIGHTICAWRGHRPSEYVWDSEWSICTRCWGEFA